MANLGGRKEMRRDNSRSTAKFDTGVSPLGIFDILSHVLDVVLERDNSDRIRVSLAKDGSKTGNLLGEIEWQLFGVDANGSVDPVVDDVFNLEKLVEGDGTLVRKVEPKLAWGDERTLLVDVIAKDLTQSVVKDMGSSVILAERRSARL